MSTQSKVWFVTGASKGLGLTLVKKLLSLGHSVAATSRNADELTKAVGDTPANSFLALAMNLKSEDSVAEAVNKTIEKFNRIDVVVNNAGYGLLGALEELSEAEARDNFEVNVFGSLNVIRQVLPQLRKQQSGHILNIASIGGFSGNYPGFGIYCATKFAVHGFTESLAAEVKEFGIHATVVSPGYFRTEFLTSGSMGTPQNPIAEYTAVRQSQQFHEQDMNNNQAGDPEKASDVMIEVASSPNPPLHLFLGQDAYDVAYAKIEAVKTDLENWKQQTISTGFTN
ncbi:SDR family NAD(P)-dependent oxidoreductase [Mucilaginibacter terrae]|uniref:NAD(P)-dependent dehydrogenase (Short-subunit alcohol dehydrogenase family) n=1 Tax=Mucilaginibacter terrae TaxID=1955052 RepID=A0ABU3H3X4_9SPHI|nr:SDR family NAD(P)-dependent oxidoreductase [Mucilaginibacter terrae]MDT3405605.1 NAD(P)-dependent dehydrogenase (short-subunit alcohol dehydrogenase family) [Mucilaginibacter terrae]